MNRVDCRNMACPLPVVTVKRALEAAGGDSLTVLLDGGAPQENVTRFARSRGYDVAATSSEEGVMLVITAGPPPECAPQVLPEPAGGKVLLITSDRLGDGPEELGRLLMKNFIMTLLEGCNLPDRILFLNRGVLLATRGSEVLEALEKLGNRGVEVLSCGVCLDFFGKRDDLAAGSVTNMFAVVETLLAGQGVVHL